MLRTEVEKANKIVTAMDFQPLYTASILSKPYPKNYTNPQFKKFDGKKGNAREHVISFLDDPGVYLSDHKLRLREYSKFLTDRAYLWFVSLPASSICTQEELVTTFGTKFFTAEGKLGLSDLSKTTFQLLRFETNFQAPHFLED